MPGYTNVAKPTGTPYTPVNSSGKEGFDDTAVLFDSATTFFDGINSAVYVNISKPTGSSYTNISKPT